MRGMLIYHDLCAIFALLVSFVAANNIEYIIFPIDGLDNSQGSKLDLLIKSLSKYADKVYASTRPYRPVPTYWGATLSEEGFDRLKGHSWVCLLNPLVPTTYHPRLASDTCKIEDIFPNEPLVEQSADYATQYSPPDELRVISQPPGPEPLDRYRDYVFRSDLHARVFIYHAELGINRNHRDFAHRQTEWLYTNRAIFTGNNIRTESPHTQAPGHSTCTASKAVGNLYGSSRLATLVVVKMPDLRPLSTCEIFSTISDHIQEHGRQGRSVISVSWGSRSPIRMGDIDRGGYWSHWRRVREQIRELSDSGNVVIFAAGNAAQERDASGRYRLEVDTAPAIFAVKSNINRLLAVSNVDNRGSLWRTSQRVFGVTNARWNLFAPGVRVQCAALGSFVNVETQTGTSFCAFRSPCDPPSKSC